jgi:peptidoglycan/xylan/chitin deacetylase (PgdA/CDA1 family)/predicted small lipoprotein YifL
LLLDRNWLRACASLLFAALISSALAGCGGKNPQTATDAAASVSAKAQALSRSSASSAPVLPRIAPTSTLQPPSYEGFEELPCFTYHQVDRKAKTDITIKPATFEAQLKTLSDLGFHTITARELVDHQTKGTKLPSKPVLITFDDGWRNQYTQAWPLLRKYGFKATFFVNPQPITQKYRAYMTREMVVELAAAGNDIESHTWKHSRLTRTRTQTAKEFQGKRMTQLKLADDWIRSVVGTQPVAIAYPYGFYDLEAIGLCQAAGYKAGFTVDEGVADARAWDAFQLKRFTITSAETDRSFRRRLLSGPLQVSDIVPAPAERIAGINTTVSVDISAVPDTITDIRLRSGPSMKRMRIVVRDGRKYAEAAIRRAKVGFRVVSMTAVDTDGRKYYASWSLVMGDSSK